MKSIIRNIYKHYLFSYYSYKIILRRLIHDENSFLPELGWYYSSISNAPLGAKGNTIPSLNYSLFLFLNELLKSDAQRNSLN